MIEWAIDSRAQLTTNLWALLRTAYAVDATQRLRATPRHKNGGARAPETPPEKSASNSLRPRHHRSHRRLDDRMGYFETAEAHDEVLQSAEACDVQ